MGRKLRLVREKNGLTLRQVEECTTAFARTWDNGDFQISASWLNRVERESRELSAMKLIVLAYVYNMTADEIMMLCPSLTEPPVQIEANTSPYTAVLQENGFLERSIRLWMPDEFMTDPPPPKTAVLQMPKGMVSARYLRGVIGCHDKTMEPMILAGAAVLIDTQNKEIATRKDWTSEYDRPIYFLSARKGYHCGFCELDEKQEWLQLIPHQLSPEPRTKRWKYGKEVEVIGRISALNTRRPEPMSTKQ
ncbi:MAG: helix-turn-helix domain-containing protein [Acidobacteriaceae bacterium]|nr:helix-turn-helix domain-containing protein [Acidobacteriaceae bacterium]